MNAGEGWKGGKAGPGTWRPGKTEGRGTRQAWQGHWARVWEEAWLSSERGGLALVSEVKVQAQMPLGLTLCSLPPHPRQLLGPCVHPNLPPALVYRHGHHQPLDSHRPPGLLL